MLDSSRHFETVVPSNGLLFDIASYLASVASYKIPATSNSSCDLALPRVTAPRFSASMTKFMQATSQEVIGLYCDIPFSSSFGWIGSASPATICLEMFCAAVLSVFILKLSLGQGWTPLGFGSSSPSLGAKRTTSPLKSLSSLATNPTQSSRRSRKKRQGRARKASSENT